MLPEVDPLAVRTARVDPELDAEESALRGGRDVDVDHGVTHVNVVQHRRASVQMDAALPLVIHDVGLPLEPPVGGVGGDVDRGLRQEGSRKQGESTKRTEHASLHRERWSGGIRSLTERGHAGFPGRALARRVSANPTYLVA